MAHDPITTACPNCGAEAANTAREDGYLRTEYACGAVGSIGEKAARDGHDLSGMRWEMPCRAALLAREAERVSRIMEKGQIDPSVSAEAVAGIIE